MKKRNLNHIVNVLVVFLSALLLVACGGGGGDSSPSEPKVAPAISNLQYWPASVNVGQGGGSVTIYGTIDFIDNNGDITTLLIGTIAIDIDDVAGVKSGTIEIMVIADTTQVGNYPFTISITDATGLSSNQLKGTFTVN